MLDNDELISTRKLHGIDDGLYEETSDKNVANIEKDSVIAHKFAIMRQQIDEKDKRIQELEEERKSILDLIFEYGQTDGEHHKMWLIDQIVRILTKDKYNEWIRSYVYDEETGDIYNWDKGIAP